MAGKKYATRLTLQDRRVIYKSPLTIKQLAEAYGVHLSTIYKTIGNHKKRVKANALPSPPKL